jgi:hypothetical protein
MGKRRLGTPPSSRIRHPVQMGVSEWSATALPSCLLVFLLHLSSLPHPSQVLTNARQVLYHGATPAAPTPSFRKLFSHFRKQRSLELVTCGGDTSLVSGRSSPEAGFCSQSCGQGPLVLACPNASTSRPGGWPQQRSPGCCPCSIHPPSISLLHMLEGHFYFSRVYSTSHPSDSWS